MSESYRLTHMLHVWPPPSTSCSISLPESKPDPAPHTSGPIIRQKPCGSIVLANSTGTPFSRHPSPPWGTSSRLEPPALPLCKTWHACCSVQGSGRPPRDSARAGSGSRWCVLAGRGRKGTCTGIKRCQDWGTTGFGAMVEQSPKRIENCPCPDT